MNEQRLLNTFLELVRTDSESYFERPMQELVVRKLQELGARVYVDNAGEKYETNAQGNVMAFFAGTAPSEPILLAAHLDTVTPGKGVKPVVQKERITSDGTTVLGGDDKAGVAIILELLATLKEQEKPYPPVEVLFTLTEERGMCGSKNLDYSHLKSREGLILDNEAHDELLIQGPSVSDIEVWIKGVAAHAGVCPEKGISAVEVAAKALAKMKLGRVNKDTVANFAIIRAGGTATNVVTDEIYLKGEARSLCPKKLEKELAHIEDCLNAAAAQFVKTVDGKTIRPHITFKATSRYGAVPGSKQAPIVKLVNAAAKRQGVNLRTVGSGGGCDANVLSGYGFTLPNLGVGVQNCHTTNEYLELKPFFTAFKTVLDTVLNYRK